MRELFRELIDGADVEPEYNVERPQARMNFSCRYRLTPSVGYGTARK